MVNAPLGVAVRSACGLLPRADARLFLRHGYLIHHVADIVRLMAVKLMPGSDSCTNTPHMFGPGTAYVQPLLPVRQLSTQHDESTIGLFL